MSSCPSVSHHSGWRPPWELSEGRGRPQLQECLPSLWPAFGVGVIHLPHVPGRCAWFQGHPRWGGQSGDLASLAQGSSFLRRGRGPLVKDPQSSPLPQEMTRLPRWWLSSSGKPAVLSRPNGRSLLLSPPGKGPCFLSARKVRSPSPQRRILLWLIGPWGLCCSSTDWKELLLSSHMMAQAPSFRCHL